MRWRRRSCPLDRRAEAVVQRWRDAGIAREVAADHGLPDRPIRRKARSSPGWPSTGRRRSTGRRASSAARTGCISAAPASARAMRPLRSRAFGNLATGAYDQGVLGASGLAGGRPAAAGDRRRHAAAWRPGRGGGGGDRSDARNAGGARPGRPGRREPGGGPGRRPGPRLQHDRRGQPACPQLSRAAGPSRSRPGGSPSRGLPGSGSASRRSPRRSTRTGWSALAEQLLADAGLIGVPRGELIALLEQKAATATPGALRCRPVDRLGTAGAALGSVRPLRRDHLL